MKRTLSLLLGLSLFAATSVVAQEAKKDAPKKAISLPAQQADVAAPKFDGKTGQIQAGFAKSHESFVATAKKGEAQVVFLGDSITAGWNGQKALFDKEYAQYKAANFGIGGDQVQHVLWRVENGEFEGIKPKAVVLMIGTNNVGNALHTPEMIANGIKNIIAAIHQRSPDTKVLPAQTTSAPRTPAVAAIWSNTVCKSPRRAMLMLLTGGLSMVITAMPSTNSTLARGLLIGWLR